MKNLDWSIVLCEDVEWERRGRTREMSEEALDEAEAVCSVRTVVLWAMHAYSSGVEALFDAILNSRGGGGGNCSRPFLVLRLVLLGDINPLDSKMLSVRWPVLLLVS